MASAVYPSTGALAARTTHRAVTQIHASQFPPVAGPIQICSHAALSYRISAQPSFCDPLDPTHQYEQSPSHHTLPPP
jgi:hypothetical protein